jgi:hypothetical protein
MRTFEWLDNIEVEVVASVAASLLIVSSLFIAYRFALAH